MTENNDPGLNTHYTQFIRKFFNNVYWLYRQRLRHTSPTDVFRPHMLIRFFSTRNTHIPPTKTLVGMRKRFSNGRMILKQVVLTRVPSARETLKCIKMCKMSFYKEKLGILGPSSHSLTMHTFLALIYERHNLDRLLWFGLP